MVYIQRLAGTYDRELFNIKNEKNKKKNEDNSDNVVLNNYSGHLLERLAAGLMNDEKMLLIGDTGCGKTMIA